MLDANMGTHLVMCVFNLDFKFILFYTLLMKGYIIGGKKKKQLPVTTYGSKESSKDFYTDISTLSSFTIGCSLH